MLSTIYIDILSISFRIISKWYEMRLAYMLPFYNVIRANHLGLINMIIA